MGHPKTSCRKCGWYVRGNAYNGPNGYGGCFKKKRPTHAIQKACDDFLAGKPCSSKTEAGLKVELNSLKKKYAEAVDFIREVQTWRNGVHDYDRDMDNEPRDFSDEEEWDRIEELARVRLEFIGEVEK